MKSSKNHKETNSNVWKIALFAGILLVVGGLVAYSLISENTDTSKAATSGKQVTNGTVTSNVPVVPAQDISNLKWVKNVNTTLTQYDFVFILLDGDNAEINKKAVAEVSSASLKIRKEGVTVTNFTLDKLNPEYSETVSKTAFPKLPAVFAVNSSGQGTVVVGDITEAKLLSVFLTLAKACAPGASSGCCP